MPLSLLVSQAVLFFRIQTCLERLYVLCFDAIHVKIFLFIFVLIYFLLSLRVHLLLLFSPINFSRLNSRPLHRSRLIILMTTQAPTAVLADPLRS